MRLPNRLMVREAGLAAASFGGRLGVIRAHHLMAENIRSAALNADIVSFDIFDTAIVRALAAPNDLFFFLGDPPRAYRSARIEAEREARTVASVDQREEVSLDEIHHQAKWPSTNPPEASSSLLLDELRLEKAFCRSHPPALALFDELKEAGTTPVFISDTYLSREFVMSLLEACGFRGWAHLIVSSDHGRTKRCGGLFDIAAEHLGHPEHWLHLGDTVTPDVLNARRRGIRAGYVPRPIDQLRLSAPTLEPCVRGAASSSAASVIVGLIANEVAGISADKPERQSADVATLIDRVASVLPTAAVDPAAHLEERSAEQLLVNDFVALAAPTESELEHLAEALSALCSTR